MSDTRTPAERAYDAKRDSTLYTKPAETFAIAVPEYLLYEQADAMSRSSRSRMAPVRLPIGRITPPVMT